MAALNTETQQLRALAEGLQKELQKKDAIQKDTSRQDVAEKRIKDLEELLAEKDDAMTVIATERPMEVIPQDYEMFKKFYEENKSTPKGSQIVEALNRKLASDKKKKQEIGVENYTIVDALSVSITPIHYLQYLAETSELPDNSKAKKYAQYFLEIIKKYK